MSEWLIEPDFYRRAARMAALLAVLASNSNNVPLL